MTKPRYVVGCFIHEVLFSVLLNILDNWLYCVKRRKYSCHARDVISMNVIQWLNCELILNTYYRHVVTVPLLYQSIP